MQSQLFDVSTGRHETVADLTGECSAFVRDETDGLLHVFVPHATAGIAILETGAGSDDDLLVCCASSCHQTPPGGTGTAVPATGAITCCPRSSRRTPRCPSSMAGWRWAPGSRCAS